MDGVDGKRSGAIPHRDRLGETALRARIDHLSAFIEGESTHAGQRPPRLNVPSDERYNASAWVLPCGGSVVLTSSLVSLLTVRQTEAFVLHELAHVWGAHLLWRAVVRFVCVVLVLLTALGNAYLWAALAMVVLYLAMAESHERAADHYVEMRGYAADFRDGKARVCAAYLKQREQMA